MFTPRTSKRATTSIRTCSSPQNRELELSSLESLLLLVFCFYSCRKRGLRFVRLQEANAIRAELIIQLECVLHDGKEDPAMSGPLCPLTRPLFRDVVVVFLASNFNLKVNVGY